MQSRMRFVPMPAVGLTSVSMTSSRLAVESLARFAQVVCSRDAPRGRFSLCRGRYSSGRWCRDPMPPLPPGSQAVAWGRKRTTSTVLFRYFHWFTPVFILGLRFSGQIAKKLVTELVSRQVVVTCFRVLTELSTGCNPCSYQQERPQLSVETVLARRTPSSQAGRRDSGSEAAGRRFVDRT